jgi:Ribonuclease G/E
MLNFVLLL